MNNYQIVIGVEIHLELATATKMFSSAPNQFGKAPNTLTNPIDLGYPGTLPQVNKQAVIFAIKLAKALNMKIETLLRFDRKHYFYPDLPKGYQITQQFHPIGRDGELTIETVQDKKQILIERIHLEEDTAAQKHFSNQSWLNFNRAGVPLIEIVTKPCMTSIEETVEYVKQMRLICLYLGISDAKMENGSFRTDINISLKKLTDKKLGNKVEIKNLNSLANVAKALEWEISHQTEQLNANHSVAIETKRFDEKSQKNVVMRAKTSVVDYRYVPDPNIAPIALKQQLIDNVELVELPWNKYLRYCQLGLKKATAQSLINQPALMHFFEKVNFPDYPETAKIIFAEIVPLMRKHNLTFYKMTFTSKDLQIILEKQAQNKINRKQIKVVIQAVMLEKMSLKNAMKKHASNQIEDVNLLTNYLQKIINNIDDVKNKYQSRPERIEKLVMGQLMKETRGQANPRLSMQLIKEFLKKNS